MLETILEAVVTILQILMCTLLSVIAVSLIIIAVQITIAYSLEIAETYQNRKALRTFNKENI